MKIEIEPVKDLGCVKIISYCIQCDFHRHYPEYKEDYCQYGGFLGNGIGKLIKKIKYLFKVRPKWCPLF